MDITIAVVVTKNPVFLEAVVTVLNDIRGDVFQRVFVDADWPAESGRPAETPVYAEARDKAVHYLSTREDRMVLRVVQADTLDRAAETLIALRGRLDRGFQVGMVYVDFSDPAYASLTVDAADAALCGFYERLDEAAVPSFQSPSSTVVFVSPERRRIRYLPMTFIKCVMPEDAGVLQTWLLCLWMDFFEMSYANRRVKAGVRRQPSSALADTLSAFLTERAGADWLTLYYSGSVVSNLINAFEAAAADSTVLRGPSEHSLACGAMANWQLYGRPFITITTSGMIDEMKGTLANLREARAKGFIICAEQRERTWFAFQASITGDEDSRDVIRARRLPSLYMDDPDRLAEDLEKAMTLYDSGEGPVVLLVTQTVMDTPGPVQARLPAVPNVSGAAVADGGDPASLDAVMTLLNRGPERLVWQCGALDDDEQAQVERIAERAGIALVDGLAHPGAVRKYRDGRRNPNYLGTLAVYGFSAPVHDFLHRNGKIAPRDEQCLFFIKSKIAQVCTPFTEAKLGRSFTITQVTNNPDHVAPFVDHPVVMDTRAFLQAVERRLDVAPDLRARRNAALRAVRDTQSDVVCKLPAVPMSPNYFFRQFGHLIETLITRDDYDYTGVYDVGRSGVSAIRNVPRTRRGFSGWYGRALMGDALLATLSLAHTCPTDLIAFVGDGARAMVPDVLPSMIENALAGRPWTDKTVTIFTFANGGLSLINSYQERIMFNRTSRQMRLVNIAQDDWEETIAGLTVVSRTLDTADLPFMEQALKERGRLNLFTVNLAHNNEGDGLTLATAAGWQRDRVPVPAE